MHGIFGTQHKICYLSIYLMLCAKNTVRLLLKSVAVAGIIGNVFTRLFICLLVCMYYR